MRPRFTILIAIVFVYLVGVGALSASDLLPDAVPPYTEPVANQTPAPGPVCLSSFEDLTELDAGRLLRYWGPGAAGLLALIGLGEWWGSSRSV